MVRGVLCCPPTAPACGRTSVAGWCGHAWQKHRIQQAFSTPHHSPADDKGAYDACGACLCSTANRKGASPYNLSEGVGGISVTRVAVVVVLGCAVPARSSNTAATSPQPTCNDVAASDTGMQHIRLCWRWVVTAAMQTQLEAWFSCTG